MAVEIAFRFITGQYQATPWDRAVNEAVTEWPPSPWRLLRALIATWHTRCTDIPASEIDGLISALASVPPSYLLPRAAPSHTRHYMPSTKHRKDTSGETTLQFAPRLNLDPSCEVLTLWPEVVLSEPQRHALSRLLDQLPYLGRADSQCIARLVDAPGTQRDTHTWAVPSQAGRQQVLAPLPGVTRAQLEASPDSIRKRKAKWPPGSRWVGYDMTPQENVTVPGSHRPNGPVAVRWALSSPAPFLCTQGILATQGLRGAILGPASGHQRLSETVKESWLLAGPHDGDGRTSDHRHAHWLWLPNPRQATHIGDLALWVPDGIPSKLMSRVLKAKRLPRFGYAPKEYRPGAELHLQAMGSAESVLPELVSATETTWVTRTPMLTGRFPKKYGDRTAFARREVERELVFRFGDAAPGVQVQLQQSWDAPEVMKYRRYRWKESMAARRRGMCLKLELDGPLPNQDGPSPLLLGALSHFGFGLFTPPPS